MSSWEEKVYSKGRQLNRYPYDTVVSDLFRWSAGRDRSGLRVLEVGCGSGNNLWFLSREGFQCAGIDLSKTAVNYAKQYLAGDGLEADIRVGDISQLPWEDGHFDLVIDRISITHNSMRDIQQMHDEVVRVLRHGGEFFSVMLAWDHPVHQNSKEISHHAFREFSDPIFSEAGLTFFADKADVYQLFGDKFSKFECRKVVNMSEDDQILTAMWNVHGWK
ncbi:MAG: class I SAM-dependent methyltransferase [Gammaproteobacteria bacterium]|jgi:SAM-dependent methyltransferase|nr:class I SAM-dependent methyltransferase [Gammaproteobacteria bacterium]